eukprot:m.87457 g.87457  ORF g.87457 m.87457 type:complete len:841 (-) comp8318_c0_seq2:805-3327(-)
MAAIHEGTLVKRGNTIHSWKERLFVLAADNSLTYYEVDSHGARSPRGSKCNLDTCTALRSAAQVNIKWPSDVDPQCCFVLVTPSRTHYLVARNLYYARVWLCVLRSRAVNLKEYMDSPVGPELANTLEEDCSANIAGLASSLAAAVDAGHTRDASEALSGLVFSAGAGAAVQDQIASSSAIPAACRLVAAPLDALAAAEPTRLLVLRLVAALVTGSEWRKLEIQKTVPLSALKDLVRLGAHAEKQQATLVLLGLLTGTLERVNQVLDRGGIDLVTTLLTHGTEEHRLDAAAIALRTCVGARKEAFFGCGAVAALVPLLHAPSAVLVSRVVGLLCHLAGGGGNAPARADAILSCQGHDRLIALLSAEDETVVCDAAATLGNLALFVPPDSLPRHRETLQHACIPLISLLGHESLNVRLSATGAISSLARLSDPMRADIVQSSAALHALRAALAPDAPRALAVEAARALNNLTDGDKGRCDRAAVVVAAGCVAPIVKQLSQLAAVADQDDPLASALLDALTNFAWGGDGPSNAIVEEGGCTAILPFLVAASPLARKASQCVRNLCAFTERQARAFALARAGVVPLLCALLEAEDHDVRVQAAAALRNMANGEKLVDPALRMAIIGDPHALRGLKALLASGDAAAGTQAMHALCHLAQSDCARSALHDAGIPALIASADVQAMLDAAPAVRHIAELLANSLQERTPGNVFRLGERYVTLLADDADAVCAAAIAAALDKQARVWSGLSAHGSTMTAAVASQACAAVLAVCSKAYAASASLRAAHESALQAGRPVSYINAESGFVATGWLGQAIGATRILECPDSTPSAALIAEVIAALPATVRR